MTDQSESFKPKPMRRAGEVRRAAILEAATRVFLDKGFESASLTDITALAGGSRRTIYDQFRDKEGLFEEMMALRCAEILEPMDDPMLLSAATDAALILKVIADRFLAVMTSEVVGALRRIGMAEGAKFPRIASIFFERGVDPAIAKVTGVFEVLNARSEWRFDDPQLTAIAFLSMVQGDAIDRLTARSPNRRPVDMLNRQIEYAIAVTLCFARQRARDALIPPTVG